MASMFGDRMATAVATAGNCAVVGLDPHLDRLPSSLRARFEGRTGATFRAEAAAAVMDFNRIVIDAVSGRVAAVKPQFAFYEALGAPGFAALEETCAIARDAGLLVIADAKRGDIASTAAAYARSILSLDGPFQADAVTVNPWMGADTLDPFIDVCAESGGGLFVLVRTTNPGSAFLQHHGSPGAAHQVAAVLAEKGAELTGASGFSSVGAVVGAMTGDEASILRAAMPGAWFLVPGVGAQGGSEADAVAGARADGLGCLVNSSRGVLYPGPDERSAYDADPIAWIAAAAGAHAERFQVDE
jgi:orotidine-5'-phosphate decarboxylase